MDSSYRKKKVEIEGLMDRFNLLEQRHLKFLIKADSFKPNDLVFLKTSLISERKTLIIRFCCLPNTKK